MKKLFFSAFVLLLTVSLIPLQSDETNITGEWELTIILPYADIILPYSFEHKEEVLFVFFEADGEMLKAEGQVNGNTIEWIVKGEKDTIFKGKIHGDTITGECRLGGSKTYKWKAERKKEK